MLINKKEAFEDFANRLLRQVVEKEWEIERIKGIKDKSKEWFNFQGEGSMKSKILDKCERELEERKKNLEVLLKIINEQDNI